jgi:Ca2+-dependent lipid-binding protein
LQNGPFNITNDLTVNIEIIPYKSIPFNGLPFPLYFYPKSTNSVSIILYEGKNLDNKKLKNPFILFKFKDRNLLNSKSICFNQSNPKFNQYFNFEVKSILSDVLEVYITDKDINSKNDKKSKISIEISSLLNGKEERWYNFEKGGSIFLKIQLVPPKIIPFSDFDLDIYNKYIEDENQLPPSEEWQINLHLMEATNLPSADSNGLSDPYCLFTILNTKITAKSKKIEKTLNPKWDEKFRIPIQSLNSDILRIEVFDWDKVGKDDKLCMIDIPLINYEPGIVYEDIFPLIPLAGNSGGPQLNYISKLLPLDTYHFLVCLLFKR